MKYLFQFSLILFITFLGEALHAVLPFPIPASIYGLLLMLFVLSTKIVKPEQVKQAGDFLIEIMPTMFIPAAVGLITVWAELQKVLVPILTITAVTTVFVMVVAGKSAQAMIRMGKGGRR